MPTSRQDERRWVLRAPSGTGAILTGLAVTGLVVACSDPDPSNLRPRGSGGEGEAAAVEAASASLGATPLARLTRRQYVATLRDLFAPIVPPEVSLPSDTAVGGFDNVTTAQTPSPALVEAYRQNAVAVTRVAMTRPSEFLGCTPTNRGDEDACASAFVARFAKKAFRRPLAPDDIGRLTSLYVAQRTASADFATAMTVVVEAILQSPHFLYRVEPGAPIAGSSTHVRLGSYEMANRLSYLLWNTMPDDALFAAAESNALATPEGVEGEARRMLADPRARPAIVDFHAQWLRFEKMNHLAKDPVLFATFDDATAVSMRRSAEKFVEETFFGTGSLGALLTDDHAWIDDRLAPFYGVPAPGSSDLRRVPVDKAQRSGILTDVGLLAGFAHETSDSPVLRGVFVLDRLLCTPTPPPPPNIPPAPEGSVDQPKTTRERFALHATPECAGCHRSIDGIGFGFSHYDAVGKWRTTDSGFPVDASGWFSGKEPEGTFVGVVELGQKLAQSPTVHQCVTSQWTRYALGVDRSGIDPKRLAPVTETFTGSGLDMRALVFALVKSETYRTRRVDP